MNMSNRKKSLSEGEKLILMQNDTTLLRQVFGYTCTIFYCYKKLYARPYSDRIMPVNNKCLLNF